MEPKPADLRANLLIRSGNESEGALSSATISPCQAAFWARCLGSWVEPREVLYESLFYHPLTSMSVSVKPLAKAAQSWRCHPVARRSRKAQQGAFK